MEDIKKTLKKWLTEKNSYGFCETTHYEYSSNYATDSSCYVANYQYCLYLPRTQNFVLFDRSGSVETEESADNMKLDSIFKLSQAEKWAAHTWPSFLQKLKQHPDVDLLLDNDGDRPETIGRLLNTVSSNHLVAAELKLEMEEKLRGDIGQVSSVAKPRV